MCAGHGSWKCPESRNASADFGLFCIAFLCLQLVLCS